ncbi:MAG: hypothetical protein WAU37_03745, partial [Formosimonas sp.]
YEDYLNEITTLIYELYDVDEDEAVRLVVEAQDAEYFIPHDEKPELRTQENAERDAALIFESRA